MHTRSIGLFWFAGLLAACGKSSSSPYVGTWRVDVDFTVSADLETAKQVVHTDTPEGAEMLAQAMKEQDTQDVTDSYGEATLVVAANHTYSLTWRYQGAAIAEAGRWAIDGQEAVLTCATVNGKRDDLPADKRMSLAADDKNRAAIDRPDVKLSHHIRITESPLIGLRRGS